MIQLINCNSRDMSSYYSGCTLMFLHEGEPKPVNVSEIRSRTDLLVSDGRTNRNADRSELRVHYFEPFYTDCGEYVGFSVDRSYKRAPTYNVGAFKYLTELLKRGTLPSTLPINGTHGRIGHQFYVLEDKFNPVLYRDEFAGVFSDGVFYIPDTCIAERLKEILVKEGIQYDVVQSNHR